MEREKDKREEVTFTEMNRTGRGEWGGARGEERDGVKKRTEREKGKSIIERWLLQARTPASQDQT